MDKLEEKELQFLGFIGIWRRSFKIISNWPRTFLLVAVAQPLSVVYLSDPGIIYRLFQNISRTLNTTSYALEYSNKRALWRDMGWYVLFRIAYIILCLVSSLSLAGMTYVYIYQGKKVTLREIICKIWKRLMVNFLCVIAIMSVYELVFGFIVSVIFQAYPIDSGNYIIKYNLPYMLCSVGVWYMDVIWQLADTISVVEESCGFQALRKSQKLIRGKMRISFGIILVNKLLFSGTIWLFIRFVLIDRGNIGMFGLGAISLQLLNSVILLGFVVRTVLYLVCKSYHNEQIDDFVFTSHLEADYGEDQFLMKPKHGQLIVLV